MNRVRLASQTVVVLCLIALVSWPEQRQLRGVSMWRVLASAHQSSHGRAGAVTTDRRDAIGSRRSQIGYGRAAYGGGAAGGSNDLLQRRLYEDDVEGRRRVVPPAGVAALGGRLNAILGYARTPANAPVPFASLVLRNVITGAVEARAIADESGRFTFLDVVPSGYVIELVGPDGRVVATSELLPVADGDVRSTTVRMPEGRVAGFGMLGPTVSEPVSAAADIGVTAVAQPDRAISPQR